jgi:hypothetical protein
MVMGAVIAWLIFLSGLLAPVTVLAMVLVGDYYGGVASLHTPPWEGQFVLTSGGVETEVTPAAYTTVYSLQVVASVGIAVALGIVIAAQFIAKRKLHAFSVWLSGSRLPSRANCWPYQAT